MQARHRIGRSSVARRHNNPGEQLVAAGAEVDSRIADSRPGRTLAVEDTGPGGLVVGIAGNLGCTGRRDPTL